ncbi:MAG: hypothetical protein JXB62_21305 [Pirellulales bacterium]|nr:hypothetical protein [Pirellulales bacterium]
MRGGKNKKLATVFVGCCLVSCCLGCYGPWVRHGVLLRGDWSLECNRVPWLDRRSSSRAERCDSQGGQECGPALPPVRLPEFPAELPGDAGGPQPAAYQACTSHSCGASPGRVCRKCGLPERPVQAAVNYQNHPRFHPVPTRPVFSRRDDDGRLDRPCGLQPSRVSNAVPDPTASPDRRPGPIEITPPAPVPEEIQTPAPEPQQIDQGEQQDRVTKAPRRLPKGATPPSWVFDPLGLDRLRVQLEAQSRSAGSSVKR